MKTTITTLAFLASLGFSSQAQAESYEVSAGGGANYAGLDSMDSLSEDNSYGQVALGIAYRLPTHTLLAGFDTEIDARWSTGRFGGESFGRVQSDLAIERFEVGARLRRGLHRLISVYGRAGLGISWGDLRLEDQASSFARPIESDAQAALLSGGLGVDLHFKGMQRSKLQLALRVELGYAAMTNFSFDSTPESGAEDEIRIPTMSASLGSVNASGAQLGAALVASF